MEKHNVALWSSDTAGGLESMIQDFTRDGNIKIINVSHSSCWDHESKYVVYSVALAYVYEPKDEDISPVDFSDDARESYR